MPAPVLLAVLPVQMPLEPLVQVQLKLALQHWKMPQAQLVQRLLERIRRVLQVRQQQELSRMLHLRLLRAPDLQRLG